MDETWKPILNFPGYEVSDLGNVRSYIKGHGNKTLNAEPHPLKPVETNVPGKIPYHRVSLCRDGKVHKRTVHTLVLETFICPCPSGLEACHNDGHFRNNHLDNLRWDTRQSNIDDKERHGTNLKGDRAPNAKLTNAEVPKIRERYAAGELCIPLAAEFHVTPGIIAHICTGRSWKSIPGPIHIGGTMSKERTPHGDQSYFHQHPELNRGENNASAKLTVEQVLEIRERYATTEPSQDIATAFGISRSTLRHIASGLKWKHIGGPRTKRGSRYFVSQP